jgi:diguanylate cyclase (GGDEF)-like protein/PAS domain S-box-containing protein
MLTVLGCIITQHDLRLVAMAACICAIACLTTLTLLARTQGRASHRSALWLVGAAGVFGAGVWSLHFVAMLAFMPDMPIAYDVMATAASVVIAVAGSLLAFIIWRLARPPLLGAALGGLMLAAAVGGMHYTGIAAMHVGGRLSLNPRMAAASILVGAVLGILALARAGRLAALGRRLEVTGWLALCVCALHFTGMAAVTITPGLPMVQGGALLGSRALAVVVGSISLAILVLSLAAALAEQHLSARAVMELARIRLLSGLSHEVMMILRDGVVREINSAGERLFGKRAEQLLGMHVSRLFADTDIMATIARDRTGSEVPRTEEVMVRAAGLQQVPVELSCTGILYEGHAAVAIALLDLSDRKRDEERIRHLAHHDALTDLPNRALLRDRLTQALERAAREGSGVAVLYLDLDRFKPINDLLGHASGDMLLVQVARRLQAEIRASDTLARIGGDEFVIVSGAAGRPENAADLAARLVETLARPFDLAGRQVEIGVSVGIALSPADGASQETLIRAADTALYRVKDERRGTFRFYETTMDAHLQERRLLEQDLRHAVDRGELELHYQPLVNCTTGGTEAFEALLRWRHPERGLIQPADFIPLAEETGQIDKIGKWVMEEACRAAATWALPTRVAVNVSPAQFRQSDLPRVVAAILHQSGLPASRLEIEVTEGVFINDSKHAIDVLQALHEHGVCLSLDDFGTGYSSLSYLRSFAFDKIKIDKSFIKGLGQSEEAAMIVRAIIALGHNLGLSIVAEGIETPQQLAFIQAERCDYVQGYLLGRPTRNPAHAVGSLPSSANRRRTAAQPVLAVNNASG